MFEEIVLERHSYTISLWEIDKESEVLIDIDTPLDNNVSLYINKEEAIKICNFLKKEFNL